MRALVAMSGGVDSSVAAKLMQGCGIEVVGCTMKLYDQEGDEVPDSRSCCARKDSDDAAAVAARLSIPFHVFDYRDEFREKVIDSFVCNYCNGRTPNPCIECNQHLKFGRLLEKAKDLGCQYIVTGHYARILPKPGGKYGLFKASEPAKDQSYVLYRMTQEQLAHTIMPLGAWDKADTRRIAEDNAFVNAAKPDSQDICFVPDGDYARVIHEYLQEQPPHGDFVDSQGNVLGEHEGIINYTIGQRRGLKLPAGKRIYVCAIDAENNRVVLGDNEDLFKCNVEATDTSWTSGVAPVAGYRCSAKIRYHHAEQPGTVMESPEGELYFKFDEPQRAITPGQSLVLYDGAEVLGGGVIARAR